MSTTLCLKWHLSHSAMRLKKGKCSVTEAAYDCGFSSLGGYTQAFYKEFGYNPGKYVKDPILISLFIPYEVKFKELRKDMVDMENLQNIFISKLFRKWYISGKLERASNMKSTRIFYIATTIVLIILEVLIALYIHDNFIRPYVGDVLVAIVLYCFIRIFVPSGVRFLPFYVFLFAAGVEILQYFELVKRLHLENNPFMRTLLGSVFDGKDIVCYAVGCILVGILSIFCGKGRCTKS